MREQNAEIRKNIRKSGFFQWQIADALGVAETTLVRWLRNELPDDKKKAIYSAIESLRMHEEEGT